MNHREAVQIQASERYLLRDLAASERDAFEEHFFDCPICAGDVQLAASLADNAKSVSRDPAFERTPVPERRGAFNWGWLRMPRLIPIAAAFAFAVLSGYEAVQLSRLRQPRVISTVVIPPAAKGELPVIHAKSSDLVELSFNVAGEESPGPYECDLLSQSGGRLLSLEANPPANEAPLTIRLASSTLTPGSYTMVLRSKSPQGPVREVDRYPFILEKN